MTKPLDDYGSANPLETLSPNILVGDVLSRWPVTGGPTAGEFLNPWRHHHEH